jgi:hypothetical protein
MLKVNGKAFGKAVGLSSYLLTQRNKDILPILGSVLICASTNENRVALTSCDTQSFLTVEIPATVERDFRALPIADHLKPLEKYPDDVEIIQENERTIRFKTISCDYQIFTCDLDDFPTPDMSGSVLWSRDVLWKPDYGDIVELSDRIDYNKSPRVNGVNLEANADGGLDIWSTDGYVLGHLTAQGTPESSRECASGRFFVDHQPFKSFARAVEHLHKAQKPRMKPLPVVKVTVKASSEDPADDVFAILESRIGDCSVTLITREDGGVNFNYAKLYNEWQPLAVANVSATVLKAFLDHLPKDAYSIKLEVKCGKIWAVFEDDTKQIKIEDALPAEVVESSSIFYNFNVEKLKRIVKFFGDDQVAIALYAGHKAAIISEAGLSDPLKGKSGLIMPLAS